MTNKLSNSQKFGEFLGFLAMIVAAAWLFWDELPTWLIVGFLAVAGPIVFWKVAYRLGEERRKFFDRLNKIFDAGSEDAKRQFHQRETVAALDDIARAAGSIRLLLWGILILLFLLLANATN